MGGVKEMEVRAVGAVQPQPPPVGVSEGGGGGVVGQISSPSSESVKKIFFV